MGSSAAQCMDQAPHCAADDRPRRRARRRAIALPRAEDALEAGCRRCGVAGVLHRSPADCIDTLRDLIAELSENPLLAPGAKAAIAPETKRGRVHPLRARING